MFLLYPIQENNHSKTVTHVDTMNIYHSYEYWGPQGTRQGLRHVKHPEL